MGQTIVLQFSPRRFEENSDAAYRGGVVSLIEVLDADSNLLQVRDAKALAQTEAARAAMHAALLRITRGSHTNRRPGVLERTEMQHNDFPDTTYTTTWSNGRGEVRFFTRSDGSRLRYYTAGTGPPLVLMHTVRTQLDYFQRVIPLLWDHYTVYALDLPGMGWSDIVPGARYEEPELRAAVVEFASGLNLHDVTLAGESLGAALALSASIDLKGRVSRVVAFNSYDYPSGLERGNWLARFIITSVRLPGLGSLFAGLEPRPIMRAVLHSGFVDKSRLPEDFLVELLRSGRRKGYSRVARAIYCSLKGFNRARQRYPEVSAPVTLVYGDHDWSRPAERYQVASSLVDVQRITLPRTGHFSSLERPDDIARILLGAVST